MPLNLCGLGFHAYGHVGLILALPRPLLPAPAVVALAVVAVVVVAVVVAVAAGRSFQCSCLLWDL